jgi:hypothetical protein
LSHSQTAQGRKKGPVLNRVAGPAARLQMQGTKSQHVDDFLETGLSFFRHAPKTAASEKIKAKEQSKSICEGFFHIYVTESEVL